MSKLSIPKWLESIKPPVFSENNTVSGKQKADARIKMEVFQEACADAWAAIKALGRATVRWMARWVILPLSVASVLHVPTIHPMDLPI